MAGVIEKVIIQIITALKNRVFPKTVQPVRDTNGLAS